MAHKTRLFPVLAISLMTSMPAMAQQAQPQQQRNYPAESLSSAIQQVEASAVMYAQEMQRQLQAKDARITELETKCGEPCKQAPAPSALRDKP